MVAWFSVVDGAAQTRLAAAWDDAPLANLETCGMLLEIARAQVWAYAPESEDDDGLAVAIPATSVSRLVYAQLEQAKNLWNAGRVTSSGDIGGTGYTFTPRPLDKTIRGIIRPIEGRPDVG